ncbi:DUF2000 domain-containing protein [Sporolactobacillus shoreicorticis]|uniref:DUF2000 domain-containing protein n=1 Tax=Sporolactobacillus shoreicorticis TaxID=1923877 RepID=A0ABW5S7A1_9BACL|nr:DUF2000 domain-containing protein [Sporolactobacillus shoreicorticis]MCO7126880.1 DUF2000 domain-containing protein [Sporolactobacillus shoreicorticis]
MNDSEKKCVIVIDHELPIGVIANTAAILGCTLGSDFSEVVGNDIEDGSGFQHRGIVNLPIPVLSSTREGLMNIHCEVKNQSCKKIDLIDFTTTAQRSKDYEDYTAKLHNTATEDLNFLGLCLYGEKKAVNHLTGSLPTLK